MNERRHAYVEETVLRKLVGSATVACGIHCLLTPILVLAFPVLALSETVEWLVMLGSVPFGTLLVLTGPPVRRASILSLLAVGAMVWMASLSGWLEPIPEAVTSAAGSLLFASSLLWSAQECRSGACDVSSDV